MEHEASFGRWLQRRRQSLNLTQQALGALIGSSAGMIRKIEADERRPSSESARLIAKWLQLVPEEQVAFLRFARGESSLAPAVLSPSPDAPWRTPTVAANNLPAPFTTLIGREQTVAHVSALLRRTAVRLLTLTGFGGIGKTRLGVAAAAALRDAFVDGTVFVSLAALRDPELVLMTIADTLDVKETSGQSRFETVLRHLRDRQLLLVLDNFEQVLKAARLVAELLAAAPCLKVLVTSRTPLHLYGEHEFPVPPLAMPDHKHIQSLELLAECEAVALFVACAQAVKPDFQLTSGNAPAVAEICIRLDGVPLSIELAAARSKLLPPQAILARLGSRLTLLTGGPRDLPARQQTLRDTLDWSYSLLAQGEQTLLARLGVFVGGCTLMATETVCNGGNDCLTDVLKGVQELVDHSLLRQVGDENGEPRLLMLETIREYALERLAAQGDMEALRRQHSAYYLQLVETAESKLSGAEQAIWLNCLEAELDNVRAALTWYRNADRNAESVLRLAGALGLFWLIRGHVSEGRAWLEGSLEGYRGQEDMSGSGAVVGQDVRAKAFLAAGSLASSQGDYARAAAHIEAGLALFRNLENHTGIAWALLSQGRLARTRGDYGLAGKLLEESLLLLRKQGRRGGLSLALLSLGDVALDQGDRAHAASRFQEALDEDQNEGNRDGSAWALARLGHVARTHGDDGRAATLYQESLALFRSLGHQGGIGETLLGLGQVAHAQGDDARAASLYDESLALYQELGNKLWVANCLFALAQVANATRPSSEQSAGRGQSVEPTRRAVRLFAAGEALRDSLGAPLSPVARAAFNQGVEEARALLDVAAFDAAWAEGRAMSLEQAIAYALT